MDFKIAVSRDRRLAATIFAAISIVVGTGVLSARADGIFSPVTNFFSAPFGGGKPSQQGPDNGTIDYRPRPALVVPPNDDLPPPHAVVRTGTDWPKDPDRAALARARADSRQPAPSSDSQIQGGPSQPVFVPDAGPNCNSIAGMPLCFKTPWGQQVTLPGAQKSGNSGVYVSGSPTRPYLIDPPITYLQPVQISDEDAGDNANGAAAAGPAPQAVGSPGVAPPHPAQNCMPGWFGCPDYGAASMTQPQMGLGASKQQCMFPGYFGCPAQAAAAARSAPPPSGEQAAAAAQPAAAAPPPHPAQNCMPGWFGCPDYGAASMTQPQMGLGASKQQCMFPGYFGCPANPPAQTVATAGAAPSGSAPSAGPGPTAPAQTPQQTAPDVGLGASTQKCLFPGLFGCPAQ